MLSRVASALYWIGRHLERGEHVARLLDVLRTSPSTSLSPSANRTGAWCWIFVIEVIVFHKPAMHMTRIASVNFWLRVRPTRTQWCPVS